jgi:hypothetical protein
MTTDETKATEPITLEYALNLAFRAGESRMLASYKDFVQIHEPASVVVPALASRVLRLGATHTPLPVPVIDILPGLEGAVSTTRKTP